MILSHVTPAQNLASIMAHGLCPGRIGAIYLSPKPGGWRPPEEGEVLLHVETGTLPLTAFEDCSEWEVFCWTDAPIPPERLTQVACEVTGEM